MGHTILTMEALSGGLIRAEVAKVRFSSMILKGRGVMSDFLDRLGMRRAHKWACQSLWPFGMASSLHRAIQSGNMEKAKEMLGQDRIDARGNPLLHRACNAKDNVSLVRTLIFEYMADITARDSNNNTPLHVAALNENEEVVMALIKEFGCDISVKGKLGRSLLHSACEGGNVSLVRTLICEYKADVTARDSQNDTPLQVAAFSGKEEVVLDLIKEFGCDVSVKGNEGRSLLHYACEGGNVSLVRTLICEYKANVTAKIVLHSMWPLP